MTPRPPCSARTGGSSAAALLNRTPYQGPSPTEFRLESVDGRTACYRSRRFGRHPWGILGLPEGGEDAVTVGEATIRCHAAADNSLLWQVHGFVPPSGRDRDRPPTLGEAAGPVPPPAFWHFLTPRDERSSKALRTACDATVRALLDAARDTRDDEALRAHVTRLAPEAGDARVRDGVVRVARLAADVLRRRAELSRRVGIMRSGPVVTLPADILDTALVPALLGTLARPARLRGPRTRTARRHFTALAADGRFLRGEIDDETRSLAPPARARGMAGAARPDRRRRLAGRRRDHIRGRAHRAERPAADLEPAALRPDRRHLAHRPGPTRRSRPPSRTRRRAPRAADSAASSSRPRRPPRPAPEEEQTVTVTRDDAARLTRLVELVEENGPVPLTPEALAVFPGAPEYDAPSPPSALAGLRAAPGTTTTPEVLRSRPYRANRTTAAEYDDFWRRLGPTDGAPCSPRRGPGRPGRPVDGGTDSSGPRNAWWPSGPSCSGTRPYVDEELAGRAGGGPGPERRLGPRPVLRPPAGRTGRTRPGRQPHRPAPPAPDRTGRHGGRVDYAGTGPRTPRRCPVIAWALTERPVGDPAAEGALRLYERLRAWFAAPDTLVELLPSPALARAAAEDPAFRPLRGHRDPLPGTAAGHRPGGPHGTGRRDARRRGPQRGRLPADRRPRGTAAGGPGAGAGATG
ncbi:hypothetical protein LT493_02490 [Streptomyces tricolor]|nr:hypothetical protein [Streptomyces tricolor]